MGEVGIEGQ